MVRTLKLVIIMSCVSYLFGIAWYIMATIELDFMDEQDENFITYNDIP